MEEGKGKEKRVRNVESRGTRRALTETPDPAAVRSAVINRRQSARVGHAAIPASTQHMRANCSRTPTLRSQIWAAQKPNNRKFCQRIEPAKFLLNLPQPEHTNYMCNVDTPVSNTKSR